MTREEAVEKAHEVLGIDGSCTWHFWLPPGACERLVEMILEYERDLEFTEATLQNKIDRLLDRIDDWG